MTVTWTPYGPAAFEHLAEAVAAAKGGDPLAPVTVLVPSNLAGVAARRRLAAGVGGHRGVAGLAVLTVDRLAERVAAPTLVGAGRRPATGPVLAAAWRGVLADDPGVFGPVAAHPATVRALVAAHRQLRDFDQGLAAIAGHGAVHRDLVRLHRAVLARLSDFYDVADLRRAATALLRQRPDPELGVPVLFLPQDLPPAAADLVAALGERLTVVAGTTGAPTADAAVRRTLARLGLDEAPAAGPQPRPTAVRHASDADDEVRGVVREVVTALRTTPAHRVAVLYGSAQPYARLLAEQLGAAGLTTSGAGVRPTVERTLARLLLDLLALPAHDWRRDEVMAVIARATARRADGRRLPAAAWERLSREAGVVAGSDWDTRLRAHGQALTDAVGTDATDAYRRFVGYRVADAEQLRALVLRLRAHLEVGDAITGWPALAEWTGAAFTLVTGDLTATRLPEAEARAAERIHSILHGLAGLGTVEARADVATLRGVLELELADDLPRVGQLGTGVLVAPLSESIGLDADVVFAVGLADDLVPGQLTLDALLDETVRELGGLPPPRDHLDRAHRHLLAALAQPAVTASYPRGDLRRSALRLPSRWLDRSVPAVGAPSFAAALAASTELATEQEWRVRALAAGVAGPDPVIDRAAELTRERRSGRLTRFDGDLAGQRVPVPGEDRLTSPTALEQWVRCPHHYFLDHLLGVRAVDSPEELVVAGPLTIGSIIHYSMDEFHQRHGGHTGPWSPAHRDDLHAIARRVAADFTARGLTGHPVLWERHLLEILAALSVLLDQDDELRAAGRRQVRSELAFGIHGAPPVELALPSGRVVRLRGSADRVDATGEGIVVVDYKTGSDWSFKDISEANPTAGGSKLQLPVYAHAARAALGTPDTPVAAEYWFIGRSRSRIGVPLTPEVERVFIETIDTIVDGIAVGLFPQRPPADDAFGFGCPSCDPDGLGAAEPRRAWAVKRADPRLGRYLAIVEPS